LTEFYIPPKKGIHLKKNSLQANKIFDVIVHGIGGLPMLFYLHLTVVEEAVSHATPQFTLVYFG
jgi:hypothetical protein